MADKILIVEDERITAEDLAEVLKGLSYQVTAVVSSGAEAIQEVEENPPDLVLMDIRIKGEMDGAETARVLRERFDIPVVYLTAHADRATLEQAKRSRPLGYIVKPFHESELHASVEIALSKHRHDRGLRDRARHVADVLGALTTAIISVDQSEKIVTMNLAGENLSGWSKQEALNKSVRQVFRLADAELPIEEALERRSLVEIQVGCLIAKNGARKAISVNIAPLRDSSGGPGGAVIMFEAAAGGAENPQLHSKKVLEGKGNAVEFGRFHIVAASEPMKQVLSFTVRVARSEATTVLLEGESGTGKDLLAQFLHYSSPRRTGPFVAVNCSALPEALLESELFGREAGAYTDARTPKKGLLEVARGGTLFLDEVGDLSPGVQAKFLRVLEQQSFRRLGGVQDIDVDLRVIAATNRDLPGAVQTGAFRLDLFHRLSVIQIAPPPLREHPEDILPLANHFVQQHNLRYKANISGIARATAKILSAYDWPGNVRELRNVIERAILLEESNLLQPASIQFASRLTGMLERSTPAQAAPKADLSLKNSERNLIVQALEKTGGNKTKAAALLGISRDVLRYRMKQLKLP
ncbi:MAG: sigma 54-interacting transcriptional regulator [Acidobacteriota bacterium]|nr:sigma 54-interacting transcriptional regulator [Acidobacteriota bacterium]